MAYLLETYQTVEQSLDRIYGIDGLMEKYEWEINLGSAHLLGIDTAEIASRQTKSHVRAILNKNFEEGVPNRLVEEMCSRLNEEYDEKLKLLEAFSNGFRT